MSKAERQRWMAKVRADPKGALEADLVAAVVGLTIATFGGLTSDVGYHPAWQNIHSNAPAPVLGSLIFTAGLYVTAIGLILMATNVVVWLSGHRRTSAQESAVERQNEDLVDCSICGECKPIGQGVLVAAGVCIVAVAIGGAAEAVGGSAAIILGGLALLLFAVGAWSLVIAGGMLLLVHWTGRRARKSSRKSRQRSNRRPYPVRSHHR
jgi:hypothetical protein